MIYNPETMQLEGKVEPAGIEYDWAESILQGRPVKKSPQSKGYNNQNSPKNS